MLLQYGHHTYNLDCVRKFIQLDSRPGIPTCPVKIVYTDATSETIEFTSVENLQNFYKILSTKFEVIDLNKELSLMSTQGVKH